MVTKAVAMIPARLGSKRLPKKNLQVLGSMTLVEAAVRRCLEAGVFEEVWVSSESQEILDVAAHAGARTHVRAENLADDYATSEDFVDDFLNSHECSSLFQVHSIAPLISPARLQEFHNWFSSEGFDTGLSVDRISLETLFLKNPVNFSYSRKENSQDLEPLFRINWAITAWKSETFLKSRKAGHGGTYSGRVGHFLLNQLESIVIKDETDLLIARAALTVPTFSKIPH